jgi:hypothetical protein
MRCHITPLPYSPRLFCAAYKKASKVNMSRVPQSVWSLATVWMTGRSRFDPRHKQRIFFSNLCVQTDSEDHPAYCPMDTGGPFPGKERGRGVTLTTHPLLVSRSWMRSHTSSPPCAFIGVLWDCFTFIKSQNSRIENLQPITKLNITTVMLRVGLLLYWHSCSQIILLINIRKLFITYSCMILSSEITLPVTLRDVLWIITSKVHLRLFFEFL